AAIGALAPGGRAPRRDGGRERARGVPRARVAPPAAHLRTAVLLHRVRHRPAGRAAGVEALAHRRSRRAGAVQEGPVAGRHARPGRSVRRRGRKVRHDGRHHPPVDRSGTGGMEGYGMMSGVGCRESGEEQTRGYKDLVVWQKAVDLAPIVYTLIRKLPAEEKFGMGDQLRRACVSVAANIAEGHGRETQGDFARFLRIARGSLAELDTIFVMAQRIGYLQPDDTKELNDRMIVVRKVLQGLIRSLES